MVSDRGRRKRSPHLGQVLILVLMEYGLGVSVDIHVLSTCFFVLILVLMEYGLGDAEFPAL